MLKLKVFTALLLVSMVLVAMAPSIAGFALAPPVSVNGERQARACSSYSLSLRVPAYYVQESGDLILFVFIAVDSSGVKAAFTVGNGTTGWHYSGATWLQEWFNPTATLNVEGEGYLIVSAMLLKNVWPSGWRVVDQCFGMVPKFGNETSMPYAVTFNQDYRMILVYSVEAS
ncbi:MAG: hypothetical protein ACTSWP_05905 [Candidatus Freyarchaeota archaeon]|nr:hypothetical protein [Candidatus Freyrarchaeum guaymaensis]